MQIEQIFYSAAPELPAAQREVFSMTGWTLFFLVIGAAVLTAQLFRVIDAIERPARRRDHRTAR